MSTAIFLTIRWKDWLMKVWMIALAGFVLWTACAKDKSGMPETNEGSQDAGDNLVDTSLRKLAPYAVGAAVNVGLLKSNENYHDLVIREFNSLTPENAMKMRVIHPEKDRYDWADADYLVDFATQNDMDVHGHTLIWYKNVPDWVNSFTGDSAAFEALFKSHIQTVVGHYKGRVKSWDVVNEAMDNDGKGLRASVWLERLGKDYISRAFKYAHEADPDALLFYNDYGNEYGPTKRNAIIDLVKGLQADGAPVDGIGMQFHTRLNREDAFLESALRETAQQTGLLIRIAELDIALNPDNDQNLTFTPQLAQEQKAKYKSIARAFSTLPEEQRFGITTWNVTDADSWIPSQYDRPDWPLPFDANYQRKPAYYGIIEGF